MTSRFSYFALGMSFGVAAGLLFAPQAGARTRGYVREKAGEGTEHLKQRTAGAGGRDTEAETPAAEGNWVEPYGDAM